MQLYTDDLAALLLMLAFGAVLGWAAVRLEQKSIRVFALGYAVIFLIALLPAAVRQMQTKHALSALVAVPPVAQIRADTGSDGVRTFRVYTRLPPDAVLGFYAESARTRGWQREEERFGGLTLARAGERLQIDADRSGWDGTRGALGLTRVTYRWAQNTAR